MFLPLSVSSFLPFSPPPHISVCLFPRSDPIQSTANIGFDFSAAAGLGAVRQAPCYDMQKIRKERREKKKNTERMRHELYADRNRELWLGAASQGGRRETDSPIWEYASSDSNMHLSEFECGFMPWKITEGDKQRTRPHSATQPEPELHLLWLNSLDLIHSFHIKAAFHLHSATVMVRQLARKSLTPPVSPEQLAQDNSVSWILEYVAHRWQGLASLLFFFVL